MNILNHNTTIFLIVCQLLNCSQDYFSIKSLKSLIRKKYLTNEVTLTFGSMHKASGELMLNLTISQNPSCLLFVNSRYCDIIHVQINSKGSKITYTRRNCNGKEENHTQRTYRFINFF